MLAHEVLRKAIDVVKAGWSPGSAAARDAQDREVPLYGHATGGSARSAINPAAVKFSAYGAVAKVLAGPGAGGAGSAIFILLADMAKAKSPARMGGANYLHPLVQFNADAERTVGDVVELFEAAAAELEARSLQAGRAS